MLHPPYTPGRLHSLPASMAGGCLVGAHRLRSWLNKETENQQSRPLGERGTARKGGGGVRPREVQRISGLLWRFLAYPKKDRPCTTDKT